MRSISHACEWSRRRRSARADCCRWSGSVNVPAAPAFRFRSEAGVENYPIWIRLHPDSLDETMAISVQARLHDPLWLLGRQWQFGELRHDAGATPIDVRVDGTSAPIARMRGG